MSYLDALRKKNVKKILTSYDYVYYNFNDYSLLKDKNMVNNRNNRNNHNRKVSENKNKSASTDRIFKLRSTPINDTIPWNINLFPKRELTHKCYCSHCGTDNYIDWFSYPDQQYKKLGCLVCKTRIDVYSAYEVANG